MEPPVDEEQGGTSEFPNLYEEILRPLQASYLMFLLPDVRALIRKNELQGDADQLRRVLELPCSGLDAAMVFNQNLARIQQHVADEERADMYQEMIPEDRVDLSSLFFMVMDDENEKEECVYSVVISHVLRRVTVAFRGSVTTKDFTQDLKAVLARIPNPVVDDDHDLPDELAIHLGFREYLYGEEPVRDVLKRPRVGGGGKTIVTEEKEGKREEADTAGQQESRNKKYQIILDQVKVLLAEHPGYQLYVTGHSLGGALATIFALEAAAAESIPKPVTCITSGAPKVGNIDFLRAFEALENTGKLRCIHVANFRDIVTFSPPVGAYACCFPLCCQHRRYRHVGFRLKLTPHTFVISFPPKVQTYFGICLFDTMKMIRSWFFLVIFVHLTVLCTCWSKNFFRSQHTQVVYMNRFMSQKEDLSKMTLDGLYKERFARARWRLPVFHMGHKKARKKGKQRD